MQTHLLWSKFLKHLVSLVIYWANDCDNDVNSSLFLFFFSLFLFKAFNFLVFQFCSVLKELPIIKISLFFLYIVKSIVLISLRKYVSSRNKRKLLLVSQVSPASLPKAVARWTCERAGTRLWHSQRVHPFSFSLSGCQLLPTPLPGLRTQMFSFLKSWKSFLLNH